MKNYFNRVMELTPTKFWINNVTKEEAEKGIAAGATGCTQNPSYVWKMLSHPTEGRYASALLQEVLKECDDDNDAECILQRQLVRKISEAFMPLWEKSRGTQGYVSIQGDPVNEDSSQVIIDQARLNRVLNPNIMAKIPATEAGLAAIKTLLAEETPINATEVMGLSQVLALCDIYEANARETGKTPPMYYSLITGIFDEWLQKDTAEKGIRINPDVLAQAGMVIAKKVYREVHDRGTPLGFIGGGVRRNCHFTEMVGADACITMNWTGGCDNLIALDEPVVSRFFNPVQPKVLDELLRSLPEFGKAYFSDGMAVHEFAEFGPVEYFRHMFLSSWNSALEQIGRTRESL